MPGWQLTKRFIMVQFQKCFNRQQIHNQKIELPGLFADQPKTSDIYEAHIGSYARSGHRQECPRNSCSHPLPNTFPSGAPRYHERICHPVGSTPELKSPLFESGDGISGVGLPLMIGQSEGSSDEPQERRGALNWAYGNTAIPAR